MNDDPALVSVVMTVETADGSNTGNGKLSGMSLPPPLVLKAWPSSSVPEMVPVSPSSPDSILSDPEPSSASKVIDSPSSLMSTSAPDCDPRTF